MQESQLQGDENVDGVDDDDVAENNDDSSNRCSLLWKSSSFGLFTSKPENIDDGFDDVGGDGRRPR